MLRISDIKNVNKSKNPLTPAKLGSEKQDKKKHSPCGRVQDGAIPSNVKKPRPV